MPSAKSSLQLGCIQQRSSSSRQPAAAAAAAGGGYHSSNGPGSSNGGGRTNGSSSSTVPAATALRAMPRGLGARILHCSPSGRPQQLVMRPPHSTLVQPVPSSRPPLFCSRPLLLTPPLLLLRAGRLVIELFEDVAPAAARHLLTRCTPGAEANVQGTLFHKLLPGFGLFGGKRWVTWALRDTSALHCLQPALQLGSCTQGLLLVGGLWTVWGPGVGGRWHGRWQAPLVQKPLCRVHSSAKCCQVSAHLGARGG